MPPTLRYYALCCLLVVTIPTLTAGAQPSGSNASEKLPGPLLEQQPMASEVKAHERNLESNLLSDDSGGDSGISIEMETVSVSDEVCPPVDKFAVAQPLRYERPSSLAHSVNCYFAESDSLIYCAVHHFSGPDRSTTEMAEAADKGGNVQKWAEDGASAFQDVAAVVSEELGAPSSIDTTASLVRAADRQPSADDPWKATWKKEERGFQMKLNVTEVSWAIEAVNYWR